MIRRLFVALVLAASVSSADYNAVDEHGVRVFSKVPKVGIHPRVILSPDDIQPWREAVKDTYRGKPFFAKRYASKNIDLLASFDPAMPLDELNDAYPHIGPGSNHELLYAVIDALYHDDAERGETLCRAVANFARVVLARKEHHAKWGKIEQNIGGIEGNTGIRTGLGELWLRGGADFALAYDFLYNQMDDAQRDICRKALSAATENLICWGMNFPRGRGISNWYGYHGELAVMMLAIEGEEGWRPEMWKTYSQMIRDWAEVHIYKDGGSNEDGYTINTSLREGQFALIAMARRGENHYTRSNIRNYFKWAVLSLVPGEDSGDSVGYTSCRVAPYESAPVLARWAMPGDPVVNYYFWRYKGTDYDRQKRWQYAEWSTMLCMNWENSDSMPLEMGKLGLPMDAYYENQGLFITRSDWSDEAAYLNLEARHDAWLDRHENVDRGRFVFAALGRRWGVDNYWGTATGSKSHSLVHIDGEAQAESKAGRGKAPNGLMTAHSESSETPDFASYAVMDLSNAYNWLWVHKWDNPGEGWEPELRSFEELGWKGILPVQPERLHGCDNPTVPEYNFEGCNLWRKPNNPVEYCWRTGIMVRGDHPYAVIVDDVKKDGDKRTYDWYMTLANDVNVIPAGKKQAVLVEANESTTNGFPVVGSRRVLVTFLDRVDDIRMEEYASGRRGNKTSEARRLVATRDGKYARFRVVLYPYRTTVDPLSNDWKLLARKQPFGAELPQFLSEGSGCYGIQTGSGKDLLMFQRNKDGRSRVSIKRADRELNID